MTRARLRISSGAMSVVCELNGTRTARALAKLASGDPPVRETGKVEGREIYFLVPLRAWYRFFPDLRRHREVKLGDLAYWPRGGYLCLFFGPRPGNPPGKIQPRAPVVVVGTIVDGLDQFAKFQQFSMIEMTSIPPGSA